MDAPGLDAHEVSHAYRDLERLSKAGLAYGPTVRWLSRIAGERKCLSILDVGSGRGGLLRCLARWGRQRAIAVDLLGIDMNPLACKVAEDATDASLGIRYRTGNVFDLGESERPDVIVSCHVAHHLSDPELVRFLQWMQATARVGWLVNDLHRHALAERGVEFLASVLTLHDFVKHDGPVSVRRAFTREDWRRALSTARLGGPAIEVRWHIPFRWSVGTRA